MIALIKFIWNTLHEHNEELQMTVCDVSHVRRNLYNKRKSLRPPLPQNMNEVRVNINLIEVCTCVRSPVENSFRFISIELRSTAHRSQICFVPCSRYSVSRDSDENLLLRSPRQLIVTSYFIILTVRVKKLLIL